MKPAEMTRISVTGMKQDLKPVIERLYEMELLDIEEYSGELDTGSPFEEGEDVSELLVDLRSLLSKLPEVEDSRKRDIDFKELENKVPELNQEMNEAEEKIAELNSELNDLRSQYSFLEKVSGTGLNFEDLKGTETLNCFVGKLDNEKFKQLVPNSRYEIFEGNGAVAVFYPREEGFESVMERASEDRFNIPDIEAEGGIESVKDQVEEKISAGRQEKEQVEQELFETAKDWRATLEEMEGFLTEKVEKAEAPLNFATTESAFIAEGWIPSERFEDIEEEMARITDGRIHVQREDGGEPPVKHENAKPVQPFEDLTDLVSVPRYDELDPSVVIMLTFPLFFGFMIGDLGYGLASLMVFAAGKKYFPEAGDVFKSLMYASVATIIFGLAFGDAFGYVVFGHHSELAKITGIHIFEKIPILFHRAEHLGQVFSIAALIGLVHVNLGFLLGFYNEYNRHGFTEAFLEKASWMMLEAGAALWYFVGMAAGLPVMIISAALLYLGEGVEGVVEIPSLLSNVLSYLRLFGVSVAAVALAAVVNGIADPLFRSGSLLGIALGFAVLIFGHTFNTFIKIIEGFLQGIRLHYVEMFSKFYEGGGRKYAPFGGS